MSGANHTDTTKSLPPAERPIELTPEQRALLRIQRRSMTEGALLLAREALAEAERKHDSTIVEYRRLMQSAGSGGPAEQSALKRLNEEIEALEADRAMALAKVAGAEWERRDCEYRDIDPDPVALVRYLIKVRAEYIAIVGKLDANPLQPDQWRRVYDMNHRLEWLIDRLGADSSTAIPFALLRREAYRLPWEITEEWFAAWGKQIGEAIFRGFLPQPLPLPSELLTLAELNAVVDQLIALHDCA